MRHKKNASDIEKDFKKQFGNVNYEVINKSEKDDISLFGQYAAHITAKDLDNNFNFNIYSVVKENAGLGMIQRYETDYLGGKVKIFKI